MKKTNLITKALIIALVVLLGMSTTISFAFNANESKTFHLQYFRRSNGTDKCGYALGTTPTAGQSYHPVYQILDEKNKTTYYCLNAKEGTAWNDPSHGVDDPQLYNTTYDLDSKNDINALKQLVDNDNNKPYKNLGSSNYLNQVIWILNNIYIPTDNGEENEKQKRALLESAGLIYGEPDDEPVGDLTTGNCYLYKQGGKYYSQISQEGKRGYFYYDAEGNFQPVELEDELVEVAQQAALWYYTNYKDQTVNQSNDETYKVAEMALELKCSGKSGETNTATWDDLSGDKFKVQGWNEEEFKVGEWKEEQAKIICSYLIDAAEQNKDNIDSETGEPLSTEGTSNVQEKIVDGALYYVVGPITITSKNKTVYTLNDKFTVNKSDSTGAYIAKENGTQDEEQSIEKHIGKGFYISVPKYSIGNASTITIGFNGTYKKNEKKLWTSSTARQQPIVEVTPKNAPFDLDVIATVTPNFDLALRKVITKLVDSNGNNKIISNEQNKIATREINIVPKDIITNQTATYNHRKDPIVVKVGDKITYQIIVYNEGDIDGYASKIIDQLPVGLKSAIQGENLTSTKGNTYKVSYDANTNKIELTMTNTEGVEKIASYKGTDELDKDVIEVTCEVVEDAVHVKDKSNYLTNVAYIGEAYNNSGEKVEKDRNNTESSPTVFPEEDKNVLNSEDANSYKGDESNKSVYEDTTNSLYYKGHDKEDDEDFEKVVVLPPQFDLAIQKYISNIYSNGTEKPGREAPTIDTSKLASGEKTTAEYKSDKTSIKVKNGDFIKYTFTVYNEGEVNAYVTKVTDNIPTGLQFVYQTATNDGKTVTVCNSDGTSQDIEVDEDTYKLIGENNAFWSLDKDSNNPSTLATETYNGEATISVTCDVKGYLKEERLLKPYNSSEDTDRDGKTGLDSVSVTLVLRVNAQNGARKAIRNEAAITGATDGEGNEQDATEGGITDRDSQTNQWPGKDENKAYQDDEDYDSVILEKVDLALRKFVAAVSADLNIEDGEYLTANGKVGGKENPYTREAKVDTTSLKNDPECHDATYTMVKTPVEVPENAYVLYNIRVYNEGDVDVYAGKVTDYLPNYLDFVECPFNTNYGWNVENNGKTIWTEYLSHTNETDQLIKAFDRASDDEHGSGLYYKDVPVLCRVNKETPNEARLVNSAEITEYEDENGNVIPEDEDSEPENLEEKNKEKREEDDDDYEVIEAKRKRTDLALSKFVAAVSQDLNIEDGEYLTADGKVGSKENPYTRATSVNTTELKNNPECHDATYNIVKDPAVTIPAKSYILYNIRVYNEGEKDVYAGKVTDHLPDYLDYVECDFNTKYGWNVENDGKTVWTEYLSHANGADKLIKAFDKTSDDGAGSGLSYQDIQILCKVNDNAPTSKNLVNVAEITEYEDEDGDPVPEDEDSTPDNVDEKNEDDDDHEQIIIKTFDLSLKKYISTVYVTEDGKTTTTQTGNTGDESKDTIPKVEINRKKINSTVVKFGYTIKVTNEGDISGYAKEITDYVPQGLKFYAEDNKGWTDEGNNVISTRLLENTLLQPGESATVTVIFRWINGSENLGLKTNTAEISEDYNEEGIPDKDSTPDNKDPKEDDYDDAKVLLSVATGLGIYIIKYITIGLVILGVLGAGIFTIKKFVL